MRVENTILVTGADSRFFLMTCLLHRSVQSAGLAQNFRVLDFGLKEEEKAFFKAKGILVEAPAATSGIHPWALKAMLYDYLAELPPASNVIWIDSDIIVSPNIAAPLRSLLDGMAGQGAAVAASPEMTIADLMAVFGHLNLWPFIRAHGERKIPFTADYYNSGFVIFRSMSLLKEWRELAKSTPFHEMFDQNLFNLMLHDGIKVQSLPRKLWNFHGLDFDGGAADPLVLHATSHRAPHHYIVHQCRFAGSQGSGYELRLLLRKDFRDRQFALLEEFALSEQAALSACNLLPADWPEGKFFIIWNLPGDQACPCQSGKDYEHCHGAG